jgi:signal transduction histidine kinase
MARRRAYSDGMTWWAGVRAWRASHPFVSDVALAVVIFLIGLTGQPNPQTGDAQPLTPGIVVLLLLACIALVARRRAPLPVWGVTVALTCASVYRVGGPAPAIVTTMVALYTVAVLCRPLVSVLAAVVTPVSLLLAYHLAVSGADWLGDVTYTVFAVSAMACAIGFAVRGQRALVASAEERAERAERTREEEAQRRVTDERLRIARELHDVLAHHIAVVNVQAGVAQHLLESDPKAAAEAIGHVRESSTVALTEMSAVLGLLRTPDDTTSTQPAPGLAQADALVESVRRSGVPVTWRVVGAARPLAPVTDLTAYRLVLESLTNASKHGRGGAEVVLDYRASELLIEVRNAVPAAGVVGHGGHGIVGMRERVAAIGGSIDVGRHGDEFVVHAVLPIPSDDGMTSIPEEVRDPRSSEGDGAAPLAVDVAGMGERP